METCWGYFGKSSSVAAVVEKIGTDLIQHNCCYLSIRFDPMDTVYFHHVPNSDLPYWRRHLHENMKSLIKKNGKTRNKNKILIHCVERNYRKFALDDYEPSRMADKAPFVVGDYLANTQSYRCDPHHENIHRKTLFDASIGHDCGSCGISRGSLIVSTTLDYGWS